MPHLSPDLRAHTGQQCGGPQLRKARVAQHGAGLRQQLGEGHAAQLPLVLAGHLAGGGGEGKAKDESITHWGTCLKTQARFTG